MRADLHTHSDRSDGTDSPADLVARAGRLGLDVLALTDHDTTTGWEEALAAARRLDVGLVPGLEISCRLRGCGVHLLAYLVDPGYAPLRTELDLVLDGRNARLPSTIDRLRLLGIDITADDVHRVAGPAEALGRPHVADALVALGVCADREDAFDRFLSPGRPGYVDRYAADLGEMLSLVTAAGGVSVVAHPWARMSRRVLTAGTIGDLAATGLAGIEVDHPDHDIDTRRRLRAIAAGLDLVVTGSSDHHGDGKGRAFELGSNTTAPEQLDRLISLAHAASSVSGRDTPAAVLP